MIPTIWDTPRWVPNKAGRVQVTRHPLRSLVVTPRGHGVTDGGSRRDILGVHLDLDGVALWLPLATATALHAHLGRAIEISEDAAYRYKKESLGGD